jgi:hypothetical protein
VVRKTLLQCLAASALLLAGTRAAAAPPASGAATAAPVGGAQPETEEMNKPHLLRSGAVVGIDFGAGLAESSGYPNDVNRIGDPSAYSASGAMLGSGGSVFVMGALADYVNFGVWFGAVRASNGDFRSSGRGGGFRVEAFPLYRLVPALKDFGVMARFGIGGANLDTTLPGNYPGADGTQSYLGAGVFQEFRIFKMLGGHVSIGPALDYDAIFSRSIEWHGMTLGGRFVFYGGP